MTPGFWAGKRVFLTGHTGFKGGWTALWLQSLGANVRGYALAPPTDPSLFDLASVGAEMDSVIADIRDQARLSTEIASLRPDIIIHMAAQPLVSASYQDPVGTYATNVMGTVHVLEAARQTPSVRVVLNITSDKCYENREWIWGYRESDPMGGHDPYSNSKGCAELVTSAYRQSFFAPDHYDRHGVALASARAGNVIGGGDWAKDRLVPDIMRSFLAGKAAVIRNPHSTRPWQHVLEPIRGYLMLAESMWRNGPTFAGGWNFGPSDRDVQPVVEILRLVREAWGGPTLWEDRHDPHAPHEAAHLKLDISKAQHALGWRPLWDLRNAIGATVAWYQANARAEDMRCVTTAQIKTYAAQNEVAAAAEVSPT